MNTASMSYTGKGLSVREIVFLFVVLLFCVSFKAADAVTYSVSGKVSPKTHKVIIPFPASASTTFLCDPSRPSCLTFCLDTELAAPASLYRGDELKFTLNDVQHSPSSSNAVHCYWTCGCEFYSNLVQDVCQYPLSQLQLVISELPAKSSGTVYAMFSQTALKQDDTDKVPMTSPQAFSLEAIRQCIVEPSDRFERRVILTKPSKAGNMIPSCTIPGTDREILYEVYATQTFSAAQLSSPEALQKLAETQTTETVGLKCARKGAHPAFPAVMQTVPTTVPPKTPAPIIRTSSTASRASVSLNHAKVTLSVPKPTMELSSTRSAYVLPQSKVYEQLCNPGTPYAVSVCVETFKGIGKCSIQINDGPLISMHTLTTDVAAEESCFMVTSCEVWEALGGSESCAVNTIQLTLDHDANAIWRLASVGHVGPELKVLFSGVQLQLGGTEEPVSKSVEHDSNTAVFIPAGRVCKAVKQEGELFLIQVASGNATTAAPKCISPDKSPDMNTIVGSVYHIGQGFPVNKDFELGESVGHTNFECSAAVHFTNIRSSLVLAFLSLLVLRSTGNRTAF